MGAQISNVGALLFDKTIGAASLGQIYSLNIVLQKMQSPYQLGRDYSVHIVMITVGCIFPLDIAFSGITLVSYREQECAALKYIGHLKLTSMCSADLCTSTICNT